MVMALQSAECSDSFAGSTVLAEESNRAALGFGERLDAAAAGVATKQDDLRNRSILPFPRPPISGIRYICARKDSSARA